MKLSPDWLNPGRSNLHISLENVSKEPTLQADLTGSKHLPSSLRACHAKAASRAPLRLGRVEASYRYNRHLEYPAMGFNGGVQMQESSEPQLLKLRTTWAPRYTQPRITPNDYAGIDPNMRHLSKPEGIEAVLRLGTRSISGLPAWTRRLISRLAWMQAMQQGCSVNRVVSRRQAGLAKRNRGGEGRPCHPSGVESGLGQD